MLSRALRPVLSAHRAPAAKQQAAALSSASKSALTLQAAHQRATLAAALNATRATAVGSTSGAKRAASSESGDGSIQSTDGVMLGQGTAKVFGVDGVGRMGFRSAEAKRTDVQPPGQLGR
ncbi:hypothetical protein JCM1841_004710 [Sporobolomyces salmonicolor]